MDNRIKLQAIRKRKVNYYHIPQIIRQYHIVDQPSFSTPFQEDKIFSSILKYAITKICVTLKIDFFIRGEKIGLI